MKKFFETYLKNTIMPLTYSFYGIRKWFCTVK